MHLKYLPSVFNSLFITLFGTIYKRVAIFLADKENHRQGPDYEDSLINKIYTFQFINAYISNYIYAFWLRDFAQT